MNITPSSRNVCQRKRKRSRQAQKSKYIAVKKGLNPDKVGLKPFSFYFASRVNKAFEKLNKLRIPLSVIALLTKRKSMEVVENKEPQVNPEPKKAEKALRWNLMGCSLNEPAKLQNAVNAGFEPFSVTQQVTPAPGGILGGKPPTVETIVWFKQPILVDVNEPTEIIKEQ
jgi:hypothetical protein